MTDFVLVVPFCCPVLLRFLEFERFLEQFAGGLEVEGGETMFVVRYGL